MEKLVRGPFVDPPLVTMVPKTGYFLDFVVSFEAHFFEGLFDSFGSRFLKDFDIFLRPLFHAFVVVFAFRVIGKFN